MYNLRRIKGLKSLGGDYLGIVSGNLVEARDNDPLIRRILPDGTNFKPSNRPAYHGRKRLNLISFSGTCLIMLKSGRSIMGTPQAQLYIYKNDGAEKDQELLSDARILASWRWPSGVLFIKKSAIKNMSQSLIEALILNGWKDLRSETGERAFEAVLPKL